MRIPLKICLHVLVIITLVCVALGGHPRQLPACGPLQPTSIRTEQGPDYECLIVRRSLPSDCTQTDDRQPFFGILSAVENLGPSSYWLVPAYIPDAGRIASQLFISHPRARAPPERT